MLKQPYSFLRPAYQSIRYYTFTDLQQHEYMVQFARDSKNPLKVFIDLSVRDYDDEYSLTNAGDVYGVMSTVLHIIMDYLEAHPQVNSIQVSAVNEHEGDVNRRMKLYLRYLDRLPFFDNWSVTTEEDTIRLDRIG